MRAESSPQHTWHLLRERCKGAVMISLPRACMSMVKEHRCNACTARLLPQWSSRSAAHDVHDSCRGVFLKQLNFTPIKTLVLASALHLANRSMPPCKHLC